MGTGLGNAPHTAWTLVSRFSSTAGYFTRSLCYPNLSLGPIWIANILVPTLECPVHLNLLWSSMPTCSLAFPIQFLKLMQPVANSDLPDLIQRLHSEPWEWMFGSLSSPFLLCPFPMCLHKLFPWRSYYRWNGTDLSCKYFCLKVTLPLVNCHTRKTPSISG